ncbi:MAG: hypothetical protein AB4040_02290 [Synechococcus sp.]
MFEEIEADWVRWATLEGEVLPLEEELAERAMRQVKVERERADAEKERAERLWELGVDPDEV